MTLIDWSMEHTFENNTFLKAQERLENFTESDLVRLHGADFAKRLSNGGFHVETIDYVNHFGPKEKEYYSLGNGDREMIFKCTRL